MPKALCFLTAGFALVLAAVGCADPPAAEPVDRLASIPPDATKVSPSDDPFPPILHSPDWEDPIPLEGPINTAGGEDSPFITPDGQSLYFFFTPDVAVPAEQQLGDGVTGIWVSHRESGGWAVPSRVVLSDPGDDTLDGCGFVSGDTIWFCSARRGNLRPIDIYTARLVEGAWTEWSNAGETLNVDYLVGELHLSADGTELYYHSNRDGGMGDMDIWVTRFIGGEWQPPENVAAVNTPQLDGWPFLSEDGTELWITRLEGSPALYRSVWNGDDWGTPELVVSQFAGEATLDPAGNLYFTHHFYGDGGAIEADIYVAYRR